MDRLLPKYMLLQQQSTSRHGLMQACRKICEYSCLYMLFTYCNAAGSHPVTSISPAGNIHCAVMNVHSIVEKRFDLCAYLATYQIDILQLF